MDDPARAWWLNWQDDYRIPSDDPSEYLTFLASRRIKVRFPLVHLFKVGLPALAPNWSLDLSTVAAKTNLDFPWPELFAMAMPSVCTDFNIHPPDPRMYSTGDVLLRADMAYFAELLNASGYYDDTNFTIAKLKRQLKRRIDASGHHPTVSGSKVALIKRLKNGDSGTATVFFRNIVAAQRLYICTLLKEPFHSGMMRSKEIAEVEGEKLTLEVLRDLNADNAIGMRLMTFVLSMFQKRESQMALHQHHAQHRDDDEDDATPFVPVLFMISSLHSMDDARLQQPYHALCWVELIDNHWCLYICQKEEKTISYIFSPLLNKTEMEARALYPSIFEKAVLLIQKVFADIRPQDVRVQTFSRSFISGDEIPACNSGIVVLASLYLFSRGCPIVFRSTDLAPFREKFAHLLTTGRIPF